MEPLERLVLKLVNEFKLWCPNKCAYPLSDNYSFSK